MKKALILFLFFCGLLEHVASQTTQDLAFASVLDIPDSSAGPIDAAASVLSAPNLETWLNGKQKAQGILGYTAESRPVEVFYFPGTSNKRALVIGGMHGSELSAVEAVRTVISILSEGNRPYYNVLVIPSLFPDNVYAAASSYAKVESNFGRYTSNSIADPNRQMPCLGTAFDAQQPFDYYGRTIEAENQYLLELIQQYKPSRIVNLHAIRDTSKAGIYADPRTDCKGIALGFETDSLLAISMARVIHENGGSNPGNNMNLCPSVLYHSDPTPVPAGLLQKRNLKGSRLPDNRGFGVSLGGWATTAVCDENKTGNRNAIRVITVEFPGYKPSAAYSDPFQKQACMRNIYLYSRAITSVFANNIFTE